MVLRYSDPAATEAMSASERADVARRHEALHHRDLAGSGEMLNGAGSAYPKDTTTIRWRVDGSTALPTARRRRFADPHFVPCGYVAQDHRRLPMTPVGTLRSFAVAVVC